jgi:hypothetical protein
MSVDEWFATDVSKAVGAGYMDGYPDGTFRPNANISRQEAAMVLARILGLEATDETFGFTDIETIPAWSLWAVVAVANAGIMTGYPDGSFGPIDSFTRAETVTVLDRLVAEVFTEEGTYGNADEQTVIEGNVVVLAENVELCNYHITGDLLIAESVGEGTVTLDRVIVDGELAVKGGGANSVVIKDSTIVTLIIDKEGVRVVIQEGTQVSEAYVRTSSRVEQDVDGKGIESLTIEEIFGAGGVVLSGSFANVSIRAESGKIVVDGGHIDEIIIESDAADVVVELGSNASVANLVLDAPATVGGTGKIETATVNASGAVIEQQPKKAVVPEGVTANIGGKEVVGSPPVVTPGGPTIPTEVPVGDISVSPTTITLKVGESGTISATVEPNNATNKKVNWASSDEEVATVDDNGNVSTVAPGTAIITATSDSDSRKKATCEVTVVAALTIAKVDVVDGEDGVTPIVTPEIGQVIRANIILSDGTPIYTYPVDDRVSYKWYYAESTDTILGTEGSYTVTSDNVEKTICVDVTVEGIGEATWTAKDKVARLTVSAISVEGEATVGQQLIVKTTPLGAAATAEYQWLICDTEDGTYVEIESATNSTYMPVAGDIGKYIKVKVTGKGSYRGTLTSDKAVGPVKWPVFNQDKGYGTIQAAIDAAAENDTIAVSAGTYDEVLSIGKSLTILGVNADNDARTEAFLEAGSIVTGGIEITAGDVTIKGLTIETKGILASNIAGLTVVNNKVRNISEAMEGSPAGSINGIDVMTKATGPIVINQNRFSAIGETNTDGSAIRIVRAADSITITNNIIEDVTKNGINLYANCLANENAKLTITGNEITNWDSDKDAADIGGRAIRIDFVGAHSLATANITENKLVPPTYGSEQTPVDSEYVKLTTVGIDVDLPNNYWGSASPAFGTILLVEGTKAADCDYVPYYTDEAMTTLAESIKPEVNFTFTGLDDVTAGTVDFTITTKVTDNKAIANDTPLRYKAVVTKDGSALAGGVIKYPEAGDTLGDQSTWHSFTTDDNGVAYFGPEGGFTLTQLPALLSTEGVTTPFQADFVADEYSVTVSLLNISGGGEVVLGSGTKEFTATSTVNVTTYEELNTALEDANIETINITADITVDKPVSENRAVTINGNDKTISVGSAFEAVTATNGLFVITADATVQNLVLDGRNVARGVYVGGNTEGINVNVTGLTIQNCKVDDKSTNRGAAANSGAAVRATSGKITLSIDNCTIKENIAYACAGGISFDNVNGTLTVLNSAIQNNTGGYYAGGIWTASTADIVVELTNNTITGNKLSEGATKYPSCCTTCQDIFINSNSYGNGGCTVAGGTIGCIHVEGEDAAGSILTVTGAANFTDVHGVTNNSKLVISGDGANAKFGEITMAEGTYTWSTEGWEKEN